MKPTLWILLGVCVLWRLCVPTVIDITPTSLCKDFAHLAVAFTFGWSSAMLYRGCEKYTEFVHYGWLFSAACLVSLFELGMALLTKGPIL